MLNILIPVDGSRNALHAVQHVIQSRVLHNEPVQVNLANIQPRLPRHITRFVSAHSVRQLQQERAESALSEAVSMLTKAGVPHTKHVCIGPAAEQILECAQATGSQKIVMGSTRKNALSRFFQGSIVSKTMELSDLPVEVIAHGKAGLFERMCVPAGLGLTFLWLAVE